VEEKIEILIQYGEADKNKRLHLFLQFPDLRRDFQEIERKDLAAQMAFRSLGEQHNKRKCSRLLSLLSRIIDIETCCNLLRAFPVKIREISPKEETNMEEKTRVLICLGAATAANCIPCFEYYFGKAETVGLKTEEIQEAVNLASQVKKGAHLAIRNRINESMNREKEYVLPCDRQAGNSCCR